MEPTFHNVHIHTFTSRHVPDGFLWPGVMPLLRTRLGGKALRWGIRAIRRLLRQSRFGRLERTVAFASIGNLPSQEAIFRRVQGFYPRGTRFVALPMDMDFMGAGRAPLDYPKQLEELAALRAAYPDVVIPLFAADPRRPGVDALVREHVERHGFGGIKLYPPLGYWPFDDRLRPIYAYAQERGLPVLTHCSRGGVYFKGAITEDMRRHPVTGQRLSGDDNRTFTDHYTHPANYVQVLEEFPRLKLCLAHYGGGEEWRSHLSDPWQDGDEKSWLAEINDILRNPAWPNVFADVSATAASPRAHALLKMLIEAEDTGSRILYGSDFYMVQRDATEREFSINLRGYIGEANWRKIAVDNPLRFLASS